MRNEMSGNGNELLERLKSLKGEVKNVSVDAYMIEYSDKNGTPVLEVSQDGDVTSYYFPEDDTCFFERSK